ncbi:tyrosine-type recombinase/integrase [Thermoactinomyces daqus]|uniref:Tyrosine-type recombinase/integrase n=1 Tax=Thermoactinomyces daqus TaxID=1329516 RepID=A0A7W1X8S0_9BACL|nr:tyrosine-type recombinase/integrase [Thermoactinomyces daqus]MBA4542064.1 tyrosine-type recombinase/integrase [Thermoactinomyces daqus]
MKRRRNALTPDEVAAPAVVEAELIGDFNAALDAFIRDCRIRNLSEHTIRFYRNELNTLRQILEKQGEDTNPQKITSRIIKENVILYMMDEGRKETSINARLRAARAFFNFLERERLIVINPMEDVALVRQKRSVIQTFTPQQIKALLAQPNQLTFTGLRDYTMLMLLFETGVRVKELVNIRVDDVKFDEGMIRIRDPKGTNERLVPFQSVMSKQLRKYMNVRGSLKTDYLFVTVDNTAISIRVFQERMKEYGRLARITNVRCSPHTARHTFAKLSVLNGCDVFTLQKILGHTSLEMTKRYVEMFATDVSKSHRKFSPVERLF